MSTDFNAELHARPSIYFSGPALVEHIALMPSHPTSGHQGGLISLDGETSNWVRTQVEYHTEFVTITRVTTLTEEAAEWPRPTLCVSDMVDLLDMSSASVVCQVSILVTVGAPPLAPYWQSSGLQTQPRLQLAPAQGRCVLTFGFEQMDVPHLVAQQRPERISAWPYGS